MRARECEVVAGHVMVLELLGVLEVLDDQEDEAKQHRQNQPDDGRALSSGLRRAHRQRHGQAAADQDDSIDGAERQIQLIAALGPRLWIPDAIEHVGEEQPAEEQHLGDEEDPHPERGRLMLLLQRVEVMLEIRMVVCVHRVSAVARHRRVSQL